MDDPKKTTDDPNDFEPRTVDTEGAAPEDGTGEVNRPPVDAPDSPAAAVAQEPPLEEQLAALNDRYLRLAAEFENYKKRTAREWADRARSANADILRELLDVADNFERALQVDHPDSAYADGVRMIFQQIEALLGRHGVERIPALGAAFDPTVHDALLHVESDEYGEGEVCQEIRRGYMLHERVLRPAQVAVSRGAPADAGAADEDQDESA